MASTLLEGRREDDGDDRESLLGGQMSFLDHLDELRRRLIRSAIFVFVAFMACWFVSNHIYNFLARPVRAALANAQRRQIQFAGLTGQEAITPLSALKENDTGRYIFPEATKLGQSIIPPGASVQ